VPLGEDEERYSVEILSGGEAIAQFDARQAALTLSPAQTASHAGGDTLTVRIAQISRLTGAGYPLEAAVQITP